MQNRRPGRELRLGIADIIISITTSNSISGFAIDDIYESFLTDRDPEIILRVHYHKAPNFPFMRNIYDSGTTWSLYEDNKGRSIIQVRAAPSTLMSRRLTVLEPNFRTGDIYIDSTRSERDFRPYPLKYRLDQLLLTHLLPERQGMILHALGVRYKGQGIVFAGVAGSGKSTLAKLWEKVDAAVILNDDRVIIRKIDNHFLVYGTPWFGEIKKASAQSASIKMILFIKHSQSNYSRRLKQAEAASNLMTHSFSPWWDARRISHTLAFCEHLTAQFPCYELGFFPNEKVIDFVRGFKE